MYRKTDTATRGDWSIICDVCGFKIKASKSKKRWDGLIVCPEDWEPRHPQDFLKIGKEDQSVPFTRTKPADTFTGVPYIANQEEINVPFDQGTFTTNNEDLDTSDD